MSVYGGLHPFVAGVLNAAFVVYLSLYVSVFAILMRRFLIAFGPRALVVAPFVWTTAEFGRVYLFTGFPWVLLGYSQAAVLPIAQLASVLGVFGVSGLVASASAAVTGVAVRRATSGSRRRAARRRRGAMGRRTARVTPR